MVKRLSELSKEGKMMVLEAVGRGEIDAKDLNENTLVAYEYGDFFISLAVAADNPNVSIVCFGDAMKAKVELTTGPSTD